MADAFTFIEQWASTAVKWSTEPESGRLAQPTDMLIFGLVAAPDGTPIEVLTTGRVRYPDGRESDYARDLKSVVGQDYATVRYTALQMGPYFVRTRTIERLEDSMRELQDKADFAAVNQVRERLVAAYASHLYTIFDSMVQAYRLNNTGRPMTYAESVLVEYIQQELCPEEGVS